jgi:TPR repeat protein
MPVSTLPAPLNVLCAAVFACGLLVAPTALVAQSYEAGAAAAQEGDPARAIAIWRPLAEAGDPRAQYALAETYWGGWWGVPEDLERRAFWHMAAAAQGHAPSFVQLGNMYHFGQHFPQDVRAAVDWYSRGAQAGNADGQYFLGSAFAQGIGVPRDMEQALALWKQAAAQGHEAARVDLCAAAAEFCTP